MTNNAKIKRRKYIKWGLIGGAIVVAVVLAIVLPLTLVNKDGDHHDPDNPNPPPDPPGPPQPPGGDKYNPYYVDPSQIEDNQVSISGILDTSNSAQRELSQTQQSSKSFFKLEEKPQPVEELGVDWKQLKNDNNNQFIYKLKFAFDMLDYKTARFSLTDAKSDRYSIPEQVLNKPQPNPTMRLEMLGFKYSLNPFSFSFSDVRDLNNTYLSTSNQTLVFMDKYIQMDLLLPSQRVYGFGERVHEFQLNEGTWTMWASGQDEYDDGKGRKGSYGVHPFILVQSGKSTDDYFGLFFRNSNAQSPLIRYTEDGKTVLSYITIGGNIEMYIFLHGSAKDVIQQYHNLIGKPQLPPFWSLGWQQASWKYTNQSMVEEVVQKYKDINMPLETVYFDIPYMNKYADFSVDTENFKDVKGFADTLHKNNQRLVVIIDAALSAEDVTSKYYDQGNKDGIFIQSSIHQSDKYGKNLVSEVWPKKAVFVDWLHEKCPATWNMGLKDLYDQLPYDGLWLDMNEATTFVNGEITENEDKEQPEQEAKTYRRQLSEEVKNNTWFDSLNGDIQSYFDTYNLPFIVKNSEGNAGNYDNMTLSLNATHPGYNGESEYNLHSLYGHMMAWRTNDYLKQASDNRPFILSRSTFASSGRFASHWLGDNLREYRYMNYSIAGIMNMNMFGIPHVGADICGFFGQKRDDYMCNRWIQLATFYPLARMHQNQTYFGNASDRNEPYYLSEPYKSNAIASVRYRYSFLRMMYTCLFEVSQNGGTCFDPLFFHFPNDQNLYKDYESSFMFANSILVTPIVKWLDKNKTFEAYIPQGKWVNLADYSEVFDTTKGGKVVNVTDRPVINAFLKQGTLIPFQEDPDNSVYTTTDLIKNPITLIAHKDFNGFSTGTVFLDQGISRQEIEKSQYEHYQVNVQAQSVQFTLKSGQQGNQPHLFKRLLILDAKDLSGVNFACAFDHKWNKIDMVSNFNTDQSFLEIKTDRQTPLKFSEIKVIYYGNSDNDDVNMCDDFNYQYNILNNQVPDLSKSSTTFVLQHKGQTLPNLQATIQFIQNGVINVKWSWQLDKNGNVPAGKRTPVEVPNDLVDTTVKGTQTQKLSDFIEIIPNPFTVNFKPRNSQDTNPYLSIKGMLFDSYLNYININVKVPGGNDFRGIFGLGERANKDFFYESGVYTIWGKDQGTPDEDGKAPTKSMYGTHPFYMFRHAKESWAGVFTKLAHAADWYIENNKASGDIDIKTIATGGIADIYVMVDTQEPETIITQYYTIVGDPVLVPQWALGWNQCKWGYKSVQDLDDSVSNYAKNGIPLDVQWSDIDYMSDYKDFTYDTKAFKGLPDFIDKLHNQNQRFVPILDAGVAMRPGIGYEAYDDGVKDDVFMKIKDEIFIGKVWPNEAAFPDFFNPKTTPWWHKNLDSMHDLIKFDGLWEDMNEVSNFCDGICYESQRPDVQVKTLLPYTPGGSELDVHTASLDAYHYNNYLQLDTHSYWGTQEVKATHEWFSKNNQRTFIIERSSFAGMGKFGSRWLGDNFATTTQMGYSVTGIMLMNMFGIPLSGVDICGFNGDTFDELCARWHMVGAFYPFSRNHNSIGQKPQEPWQFMNDYEEGVKYMDIMKDAIFIKYSLIRYYYTSLLMTSQASVTGLRKAMYKPVLFEYPEDLNAYDDIKYNVMLGEALKLSINSDSVNVNSTSFYFPAGIWCNILNPNDKCFTSTGMKKELRTKAYDAYAHLREGFLIPHQPAKNYNSMNTVDLQQKPVDFHVLGTKVDQSSPNWSSSGHYANDNGLTLNLDGNWNQYEISVTGTYSGSPVVEQIQFKIISKVQATNYKSKDDPLCFAVNQNDYLNQIFIYNADSFRKSDNYKVVATLSDGSSEDVGVANWDKDTDRIVFSPKNALCMSKYSLLTFSKSD